MSEAEKRNGRRVEAAARRVSILLPKEAGGFMTVGQVAGEAEMSVPSVTKYLEAMAAANVLERFVIASRQRIYRFI
jgi:hypothetical protein